MLTPEQQAVVYQMINFDDLSCLFQTEDYVVKVDNGFSEKAKDIKLYVVENKRTGVYEAEATALSRAIMMAKDLQESLFFVFEEEEEEEDDDGLSAFLNQMEQQPKEPH